MSKNSIGFFDSGVGGTSIWSEVHKLLPNESTIYLADSINAPYGTRTSDEILQLCVKNTELLLEQNAKLIVVACNTATTNAIAYLRTNYSVPFVGIEPAIKPAALRSNSKTVGVLATKGTLTSSLFHSTAKNHAEGIKVIEQEGTGLVPLIEAGRVHDPETKKLLRKILKPMLEQHIDYLVLGCSHYPYLIPVLKEILPANINIIDSGEAVARQTKSVLMKLGLLNTDSETVEHQFYTNKDVEILKSFLVNVDSGYKVNFLNF